MEFFGYLRLYVRNPLRGTLCMRSGVLITKFDSSSPLPGGGILPVQ